MRVSVTSNRFLLFIIFTACLCIYFANQKKKTYENQDILNISSRFEIPSSKYTSILGPKLDKLPNQDDVIELFQLWKKEHGRVYSDQEEMEKKFETFVLNLKYIVETNAKRDSPHSSLLGLTDFADLSFTDFKGTMGVFRGQKCPLDSLNTTHAMVIVGYDSVDSDEYWIVKNSWGTRWGDNGYMYIKRNTGKKYGVCAINAWGRLLVKNN
ncbi:P34 probable thiol protease-like [Vicia villosa]|uniref:P34 probable thiol protease-like n=1 Tax=Vicia villosa TaxID=3911 RepID=UPI00273BCA7A|nr:P34 probable thiol protease-like [Vicia villosa]